MSEVSDLRKCGKLKEAWRLSSKLLAERPGDLWVVRDFAWVIYDYMKCYSDSDSPGFRNINAYVKSLAKARMLPLGNDEAMFFENAAKNVRFVVWELAKSGDKGIPDLKVLLGELTMWDPLSPLFIQGTINGLLKGLQKDPDSVVALMSWRGLDKFSAEDFKKRDAGDRKMWSFAEEATHKYLKALSAKSWDGGLKHDEGTLQQAVSSAKSLLADSRCKDWEWPTMSLGALLRDMGRDDEAASFLAPIVLAKPQEAWSWHAFASSLKRKDPDSYVKCLFRGLAVSRDLKMSIRLHEEAMQHFADRNVYPMAKAEAELIARCRRENGWSELESASRILSDCAAVEAASQIALRHEYNMLSQGATSCLSDYAPRTEFYLEWMDAKSMTAGIALLGRGVYTGSLRPRGASLVRKRVSYGGLVPDTELIVGEVYSGLFDEKQRNLIGGLALERNSELRSHVLRVSVGVLDIYENEKTSQRLCFVRTPLGSTRNEDVYVPPSFEGIDGLEGKLVLAKERIVYRRKKGDVERNGLDNGGEWVWTLTSLEELEDKGEFSGDAGVPSQFYVEGIGGDGGTLYVAVLPKDAPARLKSGIRNWATDLVRLRVNCKYSNADIAAHSVYRGRLYGAARYLMIDPIETVETGTLYERTVKPETVGIYEFSNGWGHVGCIDDASVPPEIAEKYSIEPGSTISARQHLVFVKGKEGNFALAKSQKRSNDHWEWRADGLHIVAPPEYREMSGTVSIAQGGFGFLSSTEGSCFMPKELIEANGLINYDEIRARVRKSWDRKRKESSWLVVEVISIDKRGPDFFQDERNWSDLVDGRFQVTTTEDDPFPPDVAM